MRRPAGGGLARGRPVTTLDARNRPYDPAHNPRGPSLTDRYLRTGIFLAPFHALDENPTLAIERDMELLEHLDRLNYHEAWIGEHHSGGFEIIACPEMFIAAAAERTRHIRLGTGVVSLPYHNPFTLAVAHDAARLHDARARDVRRRAGLAGLRRRQDRPQGGRPAPQLERIARRHHGADAGPHGHQEDRLVRPARGAAAAARPTRSRRWRWRSPASRSPTGAVAAGKHGIGMLSIGGTSDDALQGARRQLGRSTRRRRAQNGKTADRRKWRIVTFAHVARDARAGARGREVRPRPTSATTSPRSRPSRSCRPTSRDPAEYLTSERPRLHRHAGRLRPAFRAAVAGLGRRLRRRAAARAQLGRLAGDASAPTS